MEESNNLSGVPIWNVMQLKFGNIKFHSIFSIDLVVLTQKEEMNYEKE